MATRYVKDISPAYSFLCFVLHLTLLSTVFNSSLYLYLAISVAMWADGYISLS